jgi:hypothetical protein
VAFLAVALGTWGFHQRRLTDYYFDNHNDLLAQRGMPVLRREALVPESDFYKLMMDVQRKSIFGEQEAH